MRRLVIRVTLAVCAVGLILAPRAQADPSRFQVIRCQDGVGPIDATTYKGGFAPSFSLADVNCGGPSGYLNVSSTGSGNATEGEWIIGGHTPGGYNSSLDFIASANFNCNTSGATLRAYYAYLGGALAADCSGNWHSYAVPGASSVALVLSCPGFADCPGTANVSGTGFRFHTVDPNPP